MVKKVETSCRLILLVLCLFSESIYAEDNVIELENGLAHVNNDFKHYLPAIVWEFMPAGFERNFYEIPKGIPEYEVIDSRNPYYMRVDLNADGDHEYVIEIKNVKNKKKGVLLCGLSKYCKAYFAGKSNTVKSLDLETGKTKNGSMNDLGWADLWRVYDKKDGLKLFNDYKKKLSNIGLPVGDVINLFKLEGGGIYMYWNGKEIIIFTFPS